MIKNSKISPKLLNQTTVFHKNFSYLALSTVELSNLVKKEYQVVIALIETKGKSTSAAGRLHYFISEYSIDQLMIVGRFLPNFSELLSKDKPCLICLNNLVSLVGMLYHYNCVAEELVIKTHDYALSRRLKHLVKDPSDDQLKKMHSLFAMLNRQMAREIVCLESIENVILEIENLQEITD
jgi:hypothetical protein